MYGEGIFCMRGLHVTLPISIHSRLFKEATDVLRKLDEHPCRSPLFQTKPMVYSGLSDRPGILQI